MVRFVLALMKRSWSAVLAKSRALLPSALRSEQSGWRGHPTTSADLFGGLRSACGQAKQPRTRRQQVVGMRYVRWWRWVCGQWEAGFYAIQTRCCEIASAGFGPAFVARVPSVVRFAIVTRPGADRHSEYAMQYRAQ